MLKQFGTMLSMARGKFENLPVYAPKLFQLMPKKGKPNFISGKKKTLRRNFFSEETLEGVTKFYGVRPSIEYLEVATLVDNHIK